MRIGPRQGLSAVSGSLFSQYLVSNSGDASAAEKQLFKRVAAEQGSIDDLRQQLVRAGNKLKDFLDIDKLRALSGNSSTTSGQAAQVSAEGGELSEEGSTSGVTARSFSFTIGESNRPRKFGRQVTKAFRRGFEDGSDRLLKNKNLEGDVAFKVGDGDDQTSFSVHVDKNTTAQSFVDEFNAKAGGRARASLVNVRGADDPRYKIQVDTTIQQPASPPEEEGQPAAPSPIILGGAGVDISEGEEAGDAAAIAQDLKAFVKSFNSLVSLAKKENGRAGNLSNTQVDENLLDSFKDLFRDSRSEDGSVSFDAFINERGDGKLQFNADRFIASFIEDPDGVEGVLRGVAEGVSGNKGIVREFAGFGARFDQAAQSSQVRAAQESIARIEDTSGEKAEQAKADANRLQTISSKLTDRARLLQGL